MNRQDRDPAFEERQAELVPQVGRHRIPDEGRLEAVTMTRRPAARRPLALHAPPSTGGAGAAITDFAHAREYRERAERCHRAWLAGRRREIEHVFERAAAGDKRFNKMSPEDLRLTGRLRWSKSEAAQRLVSREEKFTRWSEMYLRFAEFELPIKHIRIS